MHTQDVSSAKRSNGVIGSPVTRSPKVRIGRVSGLSPEPCFPINGIARDPPGTIMAGAGSSANPSRSLVANSFRPWWWALPRDAD
jgi:hypothetical protein